MKKLLFFAATIGCLAFTGCSKDENDAPNFQNDPSIVGTWSRMFVFTKE